MTVATAARPFGGAEKPSVGPEKDFGGRLVVGVGRPGDHRPMSQSTTATATIELQLDASCPDGFLTDAEGRRRRFSSWIELAAVLEDWRSAAKEGANQ